MNAERSYLELANIYNWNTIECIHLGNLRTIDDIGDEIYSKVKDLSKEKGKAYTLKKES